MKCGRAWVIKCAERKSDEWEGWHWKNYFPPGCDHGPHETWYHWGGSDWMRNSRTMKYLREEVTAGDLAVCYQSDDPEHGRAIFGLARILSRGKEEIFGSGEFNCFDLCARTTRFRLIRPCGSTIFTQPAAIPRVSGWSLNGVSFR